PHAVDECGDAEPVDVLEREEELARYVAEVEYLHQIRMAQRRLDPRLVAEHRDELRLRRELRKNALDRDALVEAARPDAVGFVDLRHATGRDESRQPVGTQHLGRALTEGVHQNDYKAFEAMWFASTRARPLVSEPFLTVCSQVIPRRSAHP